MAHITWRIIDQRATDPPDADTTTSPKPTQETITAAEETITAAEETITTAEEKITTAEEKITEETITAAEEKITTAEEKITAYSSRLRIGGERARRSDDHILLEE